MSLLTSNTQILKEAYFGGSKHLKEAEKHIADLIEIAKNSDSKFQLSKCATNKKLENALAKQFGVKSVNIHWMRSPYAAKLYTRPYITQFSGISEYINKKNYNLTKTFKNSDKEIFLSGSDSFLTDVGFTPDEILAALLHEIGHNFDTTTLRMVTGLPGFWCTKMFSRLAMYIDRVADAIVRKFSDFFDPLMDFFFLMDKELLFIAPIQRIFKLFTPKQNSINIDGKIFKQMMLNSILSSFAGYGSERFSDSFAASYGYGVQLNSALAKLDRFYKQDTMYGTIVNNIPVVNCLYSYALIFNDIIVSISSVHPDNGNRLKSTINKLKRDLNDPSISKELKKAIEKDLDALEELYDDYLEVKDIPEFKTGVLTAYRKMNDKFFGGKFNIHEILNKEYERNEV